MNKRFGWRRLSTHPVYVKGEIESETSDDAWDNVYDSRGLSQGFVGRKYSDVAP